MSGEGPCAREGQSCVILGGSSVVIYGGCDEDENTLGDVSVLETSVDLYGGMRWSRGSRPATFAAGPCTRSLVVLMAAMFAETLQPLAVIPTCHLAQLLMLLKVLTLPQLLMLLKLRYRGKEWPGPGPRRPRATTTPPSPSPRRACSSSAGYHPTARSSTTSPF